MDDGQGASAPCPFDIDESITSEVEAQRSLNAAQKIRHISFRVAMNRRIPQ
jgi:hypothetical protein